MDVMLAKSLFLLYDGQDKVISCKNKQRK